jgi:uncharacterized protein YbjT (DUF2867 family)
VVIDVLNAGTTRGKDAEAFFVDTSRRLQQAASQAGVRHIVTLSIVGIDKASSYGYYTAKLAQEKAVREGPVPVTIVRATQFHEFAGQMLATLSRGPVALVPKMCSQPVAARTVGEVLVETAQTRPGGTIEVAGPGMVEVPDMARRLLAARGRRMLVVPVTVPGAAGRAMRGDALLANPGTRICGPTYDEWLHSDDAQAVTF